MQVRFGGLDLQYRRLQRDIDAAVARVLSSGYYIGGPEVEAFERAFSSAIGAPHAVGVANGTEAITLALRAAGVGPGDEVIVPALSAYPTTVGVVQAGAVPVFVDVRADDALLDVALVDREVTERTRAILPVHLYGVPCDGEALEALARRHGLALVEDCAQAHLAASRGRAAGTFGVAAAWSFYPTKNLGAVGDAGAVTTDDPQLAARLKRLRNYGQANRYEHVELGVNSRLDPLQAAVLSAKLPHLAQETVRRRSIAARYDRDLAGLATVKPLGIPAHAVPSRHLYPVRVREASLRDAFQRALADRGVETLIHYPIAMPDQRATLPSWRQRANCPVAREVARTVVSLPMHPDLTDEQVDHVVASVHAWADAV
jgi:dTDP-3-amino-3,4,6-trideoxy-alpha-D-glucose transaminase